MDAMKTIEPVKLDTDRLIDWLQTQTPDEEYVWQDPVKCLMGRYLADNGSRWGEVAYSDMPHYEQIAEAKPWTFGAALERAQAIKALPPPALALPAPVEEREKVLQ